MVLCCASSPEINGQAWSRTSDRHFDADARGFPRVVGAHS